MENNGWSVVFEGKIATGRRVEEVKKNLAILFRTSTGKIEWLFAGPRTVIKRNLSHPTAVRYKEFLAHIGALCSIEKAGKEDKEGDALYRAFPLQGEEGVSGAEQDKAA